MSEKESPQRQTGGNGDTHNGDGNACFDSTISAYPPQLLPQHVKVLERRGS